MISDRVKFNKLMSLEYKSVGVGHTWMSFYGNVHLLIRPQRESNSRHDEITCFILPQWRILPQSKHLAPQERQDVYSLRGILRTSARVFLLKTPAGHEIKPDGVEETEKYLGGWLLLPTGNIGACTNRYCECRRYKGKHNSSTAVSLNVIDMRGIYGII